ncbi:SUKH-4 family immunity protein [Micromonospora phytophila]|uniref:SUKH-4 family immunity protein n=1 Tax=Micromonospora phytophila TaxID=709888 RepID=UPI0020305CC1|nr:SUKH-4 family immunity protein [Micromonospora phytophila]MCM0675852.1 SUKH-4 family immunity protein [Micromonospora phytophila]
MAADPRFRSLWSADELIPYPREAWLEGGFGPDLLPAGDEIPLDVPVVYTAYFEGDIELFDTIQLSTEDGSLDIRLVVVGAVADNPDLLYVLDPRTGEILQFDLRQQDVQGVNSNFRTFVEFLYQFALFVEADEGKAGRAERAETLRTVLESIDPAAFAPDAWWPLVISQLR